MFIIKKVIVFISDPREDSNPTLKSLILNDIKLKLRPFGF